MVYKYFVLTLVVEVSTIAFLVGVNVSTWMRGTIDLAVNTYCTLLMFSGMEKVYEYTCCCFDPCFVSFESSVENVENTLQVSHLDAHHDRIPTSSTARGSGIE